MRHLNLIRYIYQMIFALLRKKWKKICCRFGNSFSLWNLEETIFKTEPVGYCEIIETLKKDGIKSDDVDEKNSDEDVLKFFKTIHGLVQSAKK